MTRLVSVIDSLAHGGAERSLVELAPRLAARGLQVRVAVLHDRPGYTEELRDQGVPVTVVGTGLRAVTALRALAGSADVVHTSLYAADVVGRLAGATRRRPVVTTLANVRYTPEQFAEPGLSTARLRAAQALDVATARTVTRFHAVSDPVADQMARALHIRRERIEVIPRGRDTAALGEPGAGRRARVRASLGLGDEPVVLAVARHEHQKGLDVLLDAVPAVLVGQPEARVLVAGAPGRATATLEHRLATGSVPGATVRLLGARDDVGDLLAAADVFLLPSRREGFPGAVLEAMAMEVPIVASDLPMVRAAVPDASVAHLVAPEDPDALAGAILDVLADPGAAAALAARARERFRAHFTVDAVADRMAVLFTSVARQR